MMTIQYATREKADSYNALVSAVAAEALFLSRTTGYSLEQSRAFVQHNIEHNVSQFFAVHDDQVIGWCDITPSAKEFHQHVGTMGMGVKHDYRGQGIGTKLLQATLTHAKNRGLERIELDVFASNTTAQALYTKFGFVVEGTKKKAKKYRGAYEDIVVMAKLF